MARKNVTDLQVIEAVIEAKESHWAKFPHVILQERTGECFKVCCRAMERAADKRLIDYGVSLCTAWPTPLGLELLNTLKLAK